MAGGRISAVVEGYKPCAAMVATQCMFAALTLWVKAAFNGGMSPMVFVAYRQAVAALVLVPIALVTNRSKLKEMRLGMKGFFLVFMAALFGYRATANQNLVYQGLQLGTSSLATTMTNLIPAITFVMAVAVGSYMDPLTLSAWTCFLSTLQSVTIAVFLLPDRSAWKIHSLFELSVHLRPVSRHDGKLEMQGVFGSGVVFYLQSWCISVRGPLYSAMFTPLCTVITTALSAIVLHEELHIGRHGSSLSESERQS
nr:unnamed protein product [Digitaria exilis]